jgi:hypothetical protein
MLPGASAPCNRQKQKILTPQTSVILSHAPPTAWTIATPPGRGAKNLCISALSAVAIFEQPRDQGHTFPVLWAENHAYAELFQ